MIELVQEASIGLWVALYLTVYFVWLLLIKNMSHKKMKEKDVSSKATLFVSLSVMLSAFVPPGLFLVIIYKLISVGVQEEVSFLLLIGTYLFASIIDFLINKLMNKVNSAERFPLLPLMLIRIPFLMSKGIVTWLFFATIMGLWMESTFWIMVVSLLMIIVHNNIENFVTGKKKVKMNKKKPLNNNQRSFFIDFYGIYSIFFPYLKKI